MEILAIIGAVVFSIGWVWLIITGYQKGGIIWGIVIFLFGWLGGLIFCIVHKTGWLQYIIFIIGSLLFIAGLGPEKIIQLLK